VDPTLKEALPFLEKIDYFRMWIEALRKNSKKAAKSFAIGSAIIDIRSHFLSGNGKVLHLHLVIRTGAPFLETWTLRQKGDLIPPNK
jgi:hypothetical protein